MHVSIPNMGHEQPNSGPGQGQTRSSFAQTHAEAHGMDSARPPAEARATPHLQ